MCAKFSCITFVLVPLLSILPLFLLQFSSRYNGLVNFVEYHPPPVPPLEGVLALNNRLTRVQHIGRGHIDAPESLALDEHGNVYTGSADGYVYQWLRDTNTIEKYAYVGGRPLGLDFDKDSNLIVAECLKGLISIHPVTRQVTILAATANDTPIFFADDVEVAKSGKIYFSDAASIAPTQGSGTRWNDLEPATVAILANDPRGRLLEYDPETRTSRVLVDGLVFPNGVALSPDQSYILVCETGRPSIRKYHISGKKAGQSEYFLDNLPGIPDGITAGSDGRFYVTFFNKRSHFETLHPYPFLKKIAVSLLPFVSVIPEPFGFIAVLDENANYVEAFYDPTGQYAHSITDAHERDGVLYIGSVANQWISILDLKEEDKK